MITLSLVHRTDEARPGWALLVSTDKSPDAPAGEAVTICAVVREVLEDAVVDLVKMATTITDATVYVGSPDALPILKANGIGDRVVSDLPEPARIFLSFVGVAR